MVDVSFHTGSTHGNFVVQCSVFSVQGHLIYILHPQFEAQLMKSMRWTDVVVCEAFDSLKDQKGAWENIRKEVEQLSSMEFFARMGPRQSMLLGRERYKKIIGQQPVGLPRITESLGVMLWPAELPVWRDMGRQDGKD